ncbi:MAG: monovalent cation/H+ antiporter complex subunit F [Gammaproteobacteria bacterium]
MPALSFPVAVFIAALLGCCALCLYRIGRGPSAPDRMVAIDILGTLVVGFIAILTAVSGQAYLLDVALVFALVSFVGSLALAKYLAGSELDE